jgi:S1-C subfamily serine protease
MRIHSVTFRRVTFRLTSYLGLLLITAVTSLTTEWAQAEDAKRKATNDKTKSISAAMESFIEGLPKLYESVSKSIVRVERTGTWNVTGVIVSTEGHILVGNGFGSDDSSIWGQTDMKVHLNDGRTVTAKAAGWSVEWRLAVMKINEEGPWPAIKLGSTKNFEFLRPYLFESELVVQRNTAQRNTAPSAR